VEAIRGGIAELRGDEARHLTRVLRVEPGQRYEISDNQQAWLAEIAEARGERVVFHAIELLASVPLPVAVTVCAGLIKFDRFEWAIEKATELGVERIVPVETARSEKGLFAAARKRAERWQRIARESSQQSRRVSAPEIAPAVRLEQCFSEPVDFRYFLDEAGGIPLLQALPAERGQSARVALLAGPEGGWTDAEREAAVRSGWQAASLSPLVLRAETAITAGVALLMNAWMKHVY
jgi:16S rRNA (uracil1498-N3)-methyltransferase